MQQTVFLEADSFLATNQHTATHCNILQHTATHCNTLQHTATRCNTLYSQKLTILQLHCNTLQHTAAHRSTPHNTASHCITLQQTVLSEADYFAVTIATHCKIHQHTVMIQVLRLILQLYCNTLQHTATHCNTPTHCDTSAQAYFAATLQHTATHCNTPTHCDTSAQTYFVHRHSVCLYVCTRIYVYMRNHLHQ